MTLSFFRLAALAALVAVSACKDDDDDTPPTTPAPSAGSANFSRYYAIGNSLTAGYADGGLYLEGQTESYPAMLAAQFAKVGGGTFAQPLFSAAQANGSGYLKLTGYSPTGAPELERTTDYLATVPGQNLPGGAVLTPYSGALNNLGVPGISVRDLPLTSYGALNPFYHRLLPDDAARNSVTYLDFIRQKTADATFFTCWLGNNDVLGYATNGAADPNAITSVPVFTALYDSAVAVVSKRGRVKGLCVTIPNVTAIPYFSANSMSAALSAVQARPLPAGAPAGARLRLTARKLPLTGVVQVVKPLSANDLFTLGARSVIDDTTTTIVTSTNPATPGLRLRLRQGDGVWAADGSLIAARPLISNIVLDSLEIVRTRDVTATFNNIIKATALRYSVPVADMNVFFDQINRDGVVAGGVTNTTAYITGNLFSLDGVHPTPRGYAVVANQLITVINAAYGATIPLLNAGEYRGVRMP